jgi:hypothetical protein
LDFDKDLEDFDRYFDEYMSSRGLTEIPVDEVYRIADEYFAANPIPDQTIRTNFEAMAYNRLTGKFIHFRRIPYTQLYWRKGYFFSDIGECLTALYPSFGRFAILNPLRWLEYFGLLSPKCEGSFTLHRD